MLLYGDFFKSLTSETSEPFAILGGINEEDSSSSTNIADIKSSDTSISAQRGSENIGLAVFKGDKLVGELTALETLCLSIINQEIDSFLISIQNPLVETENIDLMLLPKNSPKIKVNILNGTPYISINLNFTGRIYSMSEDLKNINSSYLDIISEQANKYLKNIITNYLYKTSTQYKSDINDFGKYSLSNFLTLNEFQNFDWKNAYCNSIFNVNVKTEFQ